MSAQLYRWFEEKAKRLGLCEKTQADHYIGWIQREEMRQVERMVEANNRWFALQRQMHQQRND